MINAYSDEDSRLTTKSGDDQPILGSYDQMTPYDQIITRYGLLINRSASLIKQCGFEAIYIVLP